MQTLPFYSGRPRSNNWKRIGLATICALLCAGSSKAEVVVTSLGGGAVGTRNGLTTQALFNEPYGLALDSAGNMYVADRNNNRIRKVTAAGDKPSSQTTTFISTLSKPVDVAVDADGNLLVLTSGDGRIRKYGTSGATGNLLSTNYPVLTVPLAFALDSVGNIYVTQTNGFLRKLSVTNGFAIENIVTAGLKNPEGVAVLNNNTIAVSDTGNHAIRLVDPTTGIITHLSGSTNGLSGFADGTGTAARFFRPHKIAKSPNGTLVVADRGNHRFRLVAVNGTTTTLYGVSSNLWNGSYFPGWADGGTNAHAREPVGVTVANDGDVFTTEVRWDLLRVATGAATGSGGGGGGGGTNNPALTNTISFGFDEGEASSDFVGAVGQRFYAPVTLSLVPDQTIYSFQFNVTVTNLNAAPPINELPFFASSLQKPSTDTNLPPGVFVRIEPNIMTIFPRLLTVGWFERATGTNLYDTGSQDLVKYSQAHNHQFLSENGKVILGAYGFTIPDSAQAADRYEIELGRPSGTSDGVEEPVGIQVRNGVKQVSIGSHQYIVGDVLPFRWFNAGDFGDGSIVNNDLMQVFQSGVFIPRLNRPPPDSDMFDAMDSSDGSISNNVLLTADDASIDNIQFGDGSLNVDDLYVSYRRSTDPTLKWYARFWSNGIRQVVEVPNTFPASFAQAATPKFTKDVNSGEEPAVTFVAPDLISGSSNTITVPIRAEIKGTLPIRIAMLSLNVKPLDNSPAVVGVQFSSALGQPVFVESQGGYYSAAWLNRGAAGIYGTNIIGTLTVTLPPGTPANAAYAIQFNHASASPNGLGVFPKKTTDGLITVTDRSASTLGDGIPDSWRLKHFGTIVSNVLNAASADADGDGAPNEHEYNAGTNPNDVSSILRVLNAKKETGLTVRWPSVTGKHYIVESSPALAGEEWAEVSTNIAGTGEEIEFTDSTPGNGVRFYRVRVVNE